jgi:hypothetical protein
VFPDCAALGISNPWQVMIFWGYKIFGSTWCDVMAGFASILRIFNAGLTADTSTTCFNIKTASSDTLNQMLVCAIQNSGQLLWVAAGAFLLGLFLIAIVPALLNLIHAILLLLPIMPIVEAASGLGAPNGVFVVDGEAEQMDVAPIPNAPAPSPAVVAARVVFTPYEGYIDWMARGFRRLAGVKDQKTKRE